MRPGTPSRPGRPARAAAAAAALTLGLAACDALTPDMPQSPPARPAAATPAPAAPSATSRDLARYYLAIQNDLLSRGLLRTDGGGPDTPFDADDLLRNFIKIAFYDEYQPGAGTAVRNTGTPGRLSRWTVPVRIGTEFGASVPAAQRDRDRAAIDGYARRLGRIARHPVSVVREGANFHVFVVGEDDRGFFLKRLRQIAPGMRQSELDMFASLPKSIYCLVVAFSTGANPHAYTQAVALIRAEHPDLVRLSCIHEEIAQGFGLANDSPYARPSIFNDDDEFALLTSQDELLLKMLYDPRLKPGMTLEQAEPVARAIARELLGEEE